MSEDARRSRGAVILRAFAEFSVIVVGVLVAFAVEDWSGDRADRNAELGYLQALADDLRSDSAVWSDIHIPTLQRYRRSLEAAIPIAAGVIPVPVDTLSFLRDVSGSHGRPPMVGPGPTYEELLATGSLRLIESAEVRAAIVDYYQFMRVAQLRWDARSSDMQHLIEGVLPRGMGGSALWLGGSPGGEELLGTVFGIDAALEAIVSTESARAMGQQLNFVATLSATVDDLMRRSLDLLQALDGEIDRLR